MDLSELEVRELTQENHPFQLDDLFQALSEQFSLQAQAQGVRLDFDVASEIPLQLIGDPFELQQILSHLLSNSISFTSAGHIAVTAKTDLEWTLGSSVCVVQFSVQNTGASNDPAIQDEVITLCRQILQRMNGEIGFSNTSAQGSTAWFTVPFQLLDLYSSDRSSPTLSIEPSI